VEISTRNGDSAMRYWNRLTRTRERIIGRGPPLRTFLE
jgi:hypothetical protein